MTKTLIDQFREVQATAERLQREHDRAQGEHAQLLRQANELGHPNLVEAERALAILEAKQPVLLEELRVAIDAFRAEWGHV